MGEADPPVPPVVLASASPRRSEILRMLGLPASVRPTRVEEARLPHETATAYVERLAREKALGGAHGDPEALVLGGDTVVVLDGDILEKPADTGEAESMLLRLSGREHDVRTGMALSMGGRTWSLVCRATVRFRDATAADIRQYAATGEPLDKAGGYGIQGYGSSLVAEVQGDYYAVVGFSVVGLVWLLEQAGYSLAFPGLERLVTHRRAP